MRKKHRTSLEAKLTILMLGTLFVVLLGVGHLVLSTQKQALYETKIQQFESVAQALALSAEPLVAKQDTHLAELLKQRLHNSQWELAYIVIADDKDKTLYAASKNQAAQKPVVGLAQWRVARNILGYGGFSDQSVHVVKVPVRITENRWGVVTAGFSMRRLEEALYDMESRLLLFFTIAMLAGVVCTLTFARSMSSVLKSLINGARLVARGDFSYRVPSRSADEIGDLAEAYNFMVDALSRSHEQLVEKANADSLTGLCNHRYFQERFATEFSRASRYNHPLSVLMIDIDHFKSFNDEHGHPLGDVVLCDVASILVQSLRDSDVSARYGGEEFVVLLPETAGQEAMLIAERLRSTVEKHQFRGTDGRIVPVTISIGVAHYPEHAADKEHLLKAADIALYKAKSAGRNVVCGYDLDDAAPIPVTDPYKLYVLLHANDLQTIESLAGAVDAKNGMPAGYSASVAAAASEVGRIMGLGDDERAAVYLAALLRDIGQIAIPDSILLKPEPLKKAERTMIEQHPILGHAIIQKSSHLQSVLPALLHHHERYDGSGYPYGLSSGDIPIEARIIAVVDAYQSMVTKRPHRQAMTSSEAIAELNRNAGSQFDPAVVRAFVQMLAEKGKAA